MAYCTILLKRRVRAEWERAHEGIGLTYVWGFDYAENDRAIRLVEREPAYKHEFPLIVKELSKQEAHGICARLGVKRPLMYDLGYGNNNCIGCVKGGMGYWNKIRKDCPLETNFDDECSLCRAATALYNVGYCKQEDVAREIAEKATAKLKQLVGLNTCFSHIYQSEINLIDKISAEFGVKENE